MGVKGPTTFARLLKSPWARLYDYHVITSQCATTKQSGSTKARGDPIKFCIDQKKMFALVVCVIKSSLPVASTTGKELASPPAVEAPEEERRESRAATNERKIERIQSRRSSVIVPLYHTRRSSNSPPPLSFAPYPLPLPALYGVGDLLGNMEGRRQDAK